VGKTSSRTLAAAIAAGALIAIPATASAAQGPSPAAVKAFTARADAALDRAVTMFDHDHDRAAMRQFRLSRAFLGKAKMISTRLSNAAETDAQRTRAANAWRMVAIERDENLEQLLALLDKVDAHVDAIIAHALLADTKHRDAAVAIIQDLVDAGVSPSVESRFSQLITSLTSGRVSEIGAQVNALAEVKLPNEAQKAVAMAIQSNLDAQARVASLLDGLIPQLPAASRAQLQAALDMVREQLEAAADAMDDVIDLMPPFVRPLIQRMLTDVQAMIAEILKPFLPEKPVPATTTPVTPPPAPTTTPPPPPPPAPMANWMWDFIKQWWPMGAPMPTTPVNAPAPGMDGFFDAWFGPEGFMSGFFGQG
jgi:hypothetical protein